MSDEGDFFADLLSGLKPAAPAPQIKEEDDVETLVSKPASMNELRSAKEKEENGDMVPVKRSSSPIGVGLAPPPPPLTRAEMEELMSEILRTKLFESMGALTSALRAHMQSMNDLLHTVSTKCDDISGKLDELGKGQIRSSDHSEKMLDSVSQSLRETGIGLQRVLDKQELVDAHILLSKVGKEASEAQEDLRAQTKADSTPKTTPKSKDPADAGGPSEPNPPSPATAVSTPQMKQDLVQPSSVPPPAAPHATQHAHAPSPPQQTPPQQMPHIPPSQPAASPTQTVQAHPPPPQVAYSEPASSGHHVQQPYEAPSGPETPQMDPHHAPAPQPQPTVPAPRPIRQPPTQASFPPPTYAQSQPSTPAPQAPPPQTPGPQQVPVTPSPPQQGQHPQWQPTPPQPPPQLSSYPPPPSGQYNQPPPQIPPQQQHYPPPAGSSRPPVPSGGMVYPTVTHTMPIQPPGGPPLPQRQPPQQRQAPPSNPIYGAPPPMVAGHGPPAQQTPGVSARTSTQSVPLDQVIDDVTGMGFDRTKVRSVVTEMINQGKNVDLNVVIDRLMNSSSY